MKRDVQKVYKKVKRDLKLDMTQGVSIFTSGVRFKHSKVRGKGGG